MRLTTQAGHFTIDEVGDLKGVGSLCFFPNVVARILSQFRMMVCSKLRMNYDADEHHKSGNIDDLKYDMTNLEGRCCKLSPTPQVLHVLKIKSHRNGNIFGSKSLNNATIFGGSCRALIENQDMPSDTGVLSELERK